LHPKSIQPHLISLIGSKTLVEASKRTAPATPILIETDAQSNHKETEKERKNLTQIGKFKQNQAIYAFQFQKHLLMWILRINILIVSYSKLCS
jgi:hypothetical protein